MNGTEHAMAYTVPWLVDGIVIGVGALVGMKIDEMIASVDDASEE
jgi:hypothetical protein